jgi:hypothetical protein
LEERWAIFAAEHLTETTTSSTLSVNFDIVKAPGLKTTGKTSLADYNAAMTT